jgi:hypothetical protein
MSNPKALSEDDLILAEDYVLGALSAEAATAVERRIQVDPAFRQELCALQATLRLLPQALPIAEPSPKLRDRILSTYTLRNKILTGERSPQPSPPFSPQPSPGAWQWPPLPWGKLAAIIAIGLALLLGADNLRLRQALTNADQLNAELASQTDPQSVAALLQRPNSRLVTLRGEIDETTKAAGTLLFTPGQWQQVVVSLGNLPPLPPHKIYRMWLTLENDQVIFCGEFNPDDQGKVFVELQPNEEVPKGVKASGIFVTVESASVPPGPTGKRVIVGSI